MFSEPHQGQAGISAGKLLDLKQWQKIQNLFADIIGANLWLIEPRQSSFTISSQVTPSCSDLAIPITGVQSSESCVWKAFQNISGSHGVVYHCPHRLSYFSIPIRCEGEIVGALAVGPILLGKRDERKTHDDLAKTLGLDPEIFSDRIREIKVFSHHGIRIVLEFLEELVHHLVREAYHRQELEKLVPGFLTTHQLGDQFFSAAHSNLLVNYLLDIASEVVGADSGSVLLIDETEKTFSIKSARGLHGEMLKNKHIPLTSSIAGWVASKRKSVLIGLPGTKEEVPQERLKRPKIKVSMVVPLEVGQKVLGVFCLNSKSANRRFNRNNLALLDQLGKLAGVALAKSSVN